MIRRKPRPDDQKVTTGLRLAVLSRDAGCVAPLLGDSPANCRGRLTLDHVKDALRMGVRAPSDERHLVTVCEGHSERQARAGRQWNTAHRPLLRRYLAAVQDHSRELAAVLALGSCGHVEPFAGCPGPCNRSYGRVEPLQETG